VTAHDFFLPQPIKAAAVYGLRFIIHDWESSKAIQILKNIRAAASPSSKLIIWDLLVPNACRSIHPKTGASVLPPGLDWVTSVDMQVCTLILDNLLSD
jgi:O-methyltransferase domain